MATLKSIITSAQKKGYTIDKRPFKLNIIGVRNSNATSQDKFDDNIAYFYYDDKGKLNGKVVTSTTDPSTHFLNQPMNEGGAAILKSGEYKDAYSIGFHRGKYKALVQTKPVTIIRDNDRNSLINYLAPTTTGLYGINIHKSTAGKNDPSLIGLDSAGCQVFKNVTDFNDMMKMAEISKDKYGNNFSYILIDERDTIKFRNTLILGLGILTLGVSAYIYFNKNS